MFGTECGFSYLFLRFSVVVAAVAAVVVVAVVAAAVVAAAVASAAALTKGLLAIVNFQVRDI